MRVVLVMVVLVMLVVVVVVVNKRRATLFTFITTINTPKHNKRHP